MFGFDAHPGPLRFLPAAVFLSVALAGAMAGVAIYGWRFSAARQAAEADAQEIVRRIDVGLHQSTALLRATRALIETDSAAISTVAFARFAGAVDIVEAFPGMRGVGVARWHGPAEDEAVAQRFGLVVRSSAQSTAMRATIAMLEPRDARNLAAIGFDMNSEPNRRAAMALAAQIDDFAATGPVTLAQEITPERQTGFLIYLPIRIEAAALWGFAYAPFRLIDFLDQIGAKELLDSRRARLVDATNDAGVELYVSPQGGADAKALRHVRVISFAARTWRVEMLTDPAGGALLAAPLAVSLLAAILGGFLAYLLDRLLRLSNARRVMLDEREVLLREANHRIRNAIARVGAIARASARGAQRIDDFILSFSNRLNAMANAQQLLIGSGVGRASLQDLVAGELSQVFPSEALFSIEGPRIWLDERQTQSLGLTFHELATNSAKYGAASMAEAGVSVRWRVEDGLVKLQWLEQVGGAAQVDGPSGFGSKLLRTLVVGELGGTLERHLEKGQLRIEIIFPLRENE